MIDLIRKTAFCKKCTHWHPLEYQVQRNGTKHLVYRCDSRKRKVLRATEFLPFVPGLSIPVYLTQDESSQRNPTNTPKTTTTMQDGLFTG